MLKGKHILIGVTGGIAAFKIPSLVRELKRAGADVRIVMTEAAKEFVTPVTLSALAGSEVTVGTFPDTDSNSITTRTWHIDLGLWAEVMIVAPATANTVAKLAHGYADNAVTTLALALRCPVIIAPAMDTDMLEHPATDENILALKQMGCIMIPPEEGELASGLTGQGRLPEIETLIHVIETVVSRTNHDMEGKSFLITAGPTYEPIDPVRFIGNRASGKMGFALAAAATHRGASVTLIAGNTALRTPRHVQRIDVETAEQMYRAVMKYREHADAIIMAAAVADYTPKKRASRKLKKNDYPDGLMTIELKETRDILQNLGAQKNGSLLIGFALETDNGLANARRKLREKNADMIVLNNPLEDGAGFGTETNIATILSKDGKCTRLKKMSKYDLAHEILDRVSEAFGRNGGKKFPAVIRRSARKQGRVDE